MESITEATPGRFSVSVQHKRPDGSDFWHDYDVAAFSENGTPLVATASDRLGLVSPSGIDDGKWRLNDRGLLPAVAAVPGWYALLRVRFDDDTPDDPPTFDRCPVVAWRPSTTEYGGSATALANDGNDVGPVPIDVVEFVDGAPHVELLGYFHPEWFPEPNDPLRGSAAVPTLARGEAGLR